MSRLVVLLLLIAIASVNFVTGGLIICPQNEEFRFCGTACEPKCAKPDPPMCIQVCVEDCQCLKGYRRNSTGYCVLPEDC